MSIVIDIDFTFHSSLVARPAVYVIRISVDLPHSLIAPPSPPGSYKGVDVSEPTSSSDFSCLKTNGFTFAIVRAFQSTGSPDPNAPGTINSAWSGGCTNVDV